MKAKVLYDFTDGLTKKRHRKGQVIDVTEKRFKAINKAGFGVLIKEIKDEKNNK